MSHGITFSCPSLRTRRCATTPISRWRWPMASPTVARIENRRPRADDGFRIFIDFDNTITIGDVLDGVIEKFASGDRWRELEAEWAAGRISARTCLDGQLRSLRAG